MPAQPVSSDDRRFLILVILGGIVLRLIWLSDFHGIGTFVGGGEATRTALAIARTGTFADSYYQGYGPTAHLMPLTPAIAGGIFWLFGPTSTAANLALTGWALAQTVIAWLLLHRLFARLGASPATLRWSVAFLALLPLFAAEETVDYRYWEGALALSLACLNLLTILGFERTPPSPRAMIGAAALAALTFFASPIAGLASYGCWALYALRRLRLLESVRFAAFGAIVLALLVVPWMLRNEAMLGAPIPLRSNFGLELASANHPAALSNRPQANVYAERLLTIHPYHSAAARTALAQAGGEVAYSRALGAEATRWIVANPLGFAQLSLRHLRQFFFPEGWQLDFTGWEGLRGPRVVILSITALLGLAGLALGLAQRRHGYAMLATYIALAALPYAIVQPVPRYTYLVFGMLAFLAAELIAYVRSGPGTAR